ncbi:unnamed protein product [Arabidopsis lyrata]|uniref:uncharacterized protein LOC110224867 n=1 Tax=Arabidopsis lyrata subsp. lyrata TaxID=81972 RepID=UPI000A29E8C1|nr:uncharacterized protein LOC110224867 [Arabidopsis lyrata subsp. lyrata]CAH8250773.1 unnamed protein product [Arabidopsis lyrata]|eukprot:XP_020868117.1 uncharacterized protein LOC110224867 [Arabidopsis lyrata subsp. lyrata]
MPKLPNGRMINLSYHNGNHYNSVCPKDEDAIHQKTKVWWDYENAEIPAGMDHELALDWIVKKLEEYEFGQVELKLVVGYHDSPLPKFLSNIPIIFANKCTRSKKIVTKGNQAADVKIKEMYADETPTQFENHVFISGDCGYCNHITKLIGAGHRVMMISTGNLNDSRVLLQLKWSKVFGQPKVPIIKSLKESKQAATKKARSRTHKKDLHKKSFEARQNVIANAKDENVKIPMCISLLHCGSVQFVLELVHHVQVPRITNINDICVSIHAPVAVDGEISRDVQEELARRLGRPLSTFTFQRVFGNRWNVVVKKKQDVTCREVYVQLVSAIRPLI